MIWREKVDNGLRGHLEKSINETIRYKHVYGEAKDSGNAQIWIAVANLSKQIFDVNLKLTYLERALRDIAMAKSGKKETVKKTSSKKKLKKSLKKY